MSQTARIVEVWRYPVKGMRGERLSESAIKWAGLAGDRRYAFVRGDNASRFPWLTGRIVPEMLGYRPVLADPTDPAGSPLRVVTPDGQELDIESPALVAELAQRYGGPVQKLHSGRGLHDSAPISIISTATVAALCQAQGVPPDARRFRPNLVVELGSGGPFEEEQWLGRELTLGEGPDAPRIRIDQRNERCVMITLEPDTLARTPGILSSLARAREACAGIYATVVKPGVVRAGDGLQLLASDDAAAG